MMDTNFLSTVCKNYELIFFKSNNPFSVYKHRFEYRYHRLNTIAMSIDCHLYVFQFIGVIGSDLQLLAHNTMQIFGANHERINENQ